MSPLKAHHRRPTIHLQHLPRKRRHHPLERLVTRREVGLLIIVVLALGQNGIVCSHFQHVFAGDGLVAVDREAEVRVVDGAPVGDVGFEGGFDFPVLDEVFD